MPDILLIEDNTELLRVLREAVEIDGYEVTTAPNAEDGLALLEGGYLPSIILCDVVMPHMGGLEFLRRIRQNPLWSGVVFIAMSGTNVMRQQVIDAGADYYLVKPFSFHDLFEILRQVGPPEK